MNGINILGTGMAIPKKCVTNEDISKFVDTSDEWIRSRTGIKNRYFVQDETNVDLATAAGKEAIEKSNIDKNDICCIIVATFTPDNYTPSVSSQVQGRLGLSSSVMAFDINAACTGFIYALQIAQGLLKIDPHKYALVVGSEVISKLVDFKDRGTCVLFGDGAGAAVVQYESKTNMFCTYGCKSNEEALYCKGNTEGNVGQNFINMIGSEVFKFAVEAIHASIKDLLDKSNLQLDDIDYVICHQANERIISRVQKDLNMPMEKFFLNVDKYGNTSAASIPIAINDMCERNMIKHGEKIILVGFGAGLLWGGILFEW